MNKTQPPIAKLFFGLLLLFLFTACNDSTTYDDQNNSDNSVYSPTTLQETQVFIIDKSTFLGAVIGKVQLPLNEKSRIKNIYLTGKASPNFSILKNGIVKIKKTLKSKQFFFKNHNKTIIYDLKVKIFYFSGKIYYINLKIKNFSSTNEENNISLPTPTSTPTPIGCTPLTPWLPLPRGGCHQQIQIYRIFQYGLSLAVKSDKLSLLKRATNLSRQITLKLNCGYWRTWPTFHNCAKPLPMAWTFTP